MLILKLHDYDTPHECLGCTCGPPAVVGKCNDLTNFRRGFVIIVGINRKKHLKKTTPCPAARPFTLFQKMTLMQNTAPLLQHQPLGVRPHPLHLPLRLPHPLPHPLPHHHHPNRCYSKRQNGRQLQHLKQVVVNRWESVP